MRPGLIGLSSVLKTFKDRDFYSLCHSLGISSLHIAEAIPKNTYRKHYHQSQGGIIPLSTYCTKSASSKRKMFLTMFTGGGFFFFFFIFYSSKLKIYALPRPNNFRSTLENWANLCFLMVDFFSSYCMILDTKNSFTFFFRLWFLFCVVFAFFFLMRCCCLKISDSVFSMLLWDKGFIYLFIYF